MAIIEKNYLDRTELFTLSMVATSDDLHNRIVANVEEQYGIIIKKITKKMIADKIQSADEFNNIIFVSKKKLSVLVAIDNVSFPPAYEHAVVSVCLLFPSLRGECGKLEKLLGEIAMEIKLVDATCKQNGFEVKLILSGEDMPHELSPNIHYAVNGKSQKCYISKKDLSACSPIK